MSRGCLLDRARKDRVVPKGLSRADGPIAGAQMRSKLDCSVSSCCKIPLNRFQAGAYAFQIVSFCFTLSTGLRLA